MTDNSPLLGDESFVQIPCKTDQAHYPALVRTSPFFFLLRWIVPESSSGLLLLIVPTSWYLFPPPVTLPKRRISAGPCEFPIFF